jgi:hypothetical protein
MSASDVRIRDPDPLADPDADVRIGARLPLPTPPVSGRDRVKHPADAASDLFQPLDRCGLEASFRRIASRMNDLHFHLDGVFTSLNPSFPLLALLAHALHSTEYTVTSLAFRLASARQAG